MVTGYARDTFSMVVGWPTLKEGTYWAKPAALPEVDVVEEGAYIDRLN